MMDSRVPHLTQHRSGGRERVRVRERHSREGEGEGYVGRYVWSGSGEMAGKGKSEGTRVKKIERTLK